MKHYFLLLPLLSLYTDSVIAIPTERTSAEIFPLDVLGFEPNSPVVEAIFQAMDRPPSPHLLKLVNGVQRAFYTFEEILLDNEVSVPRAKATLAVSSVPPSSSEPALFPKTSELDKIVIPAPIEKTLPFNPLVATADAEKNLSAAAVIDAQVTSAPATRETTPVLLAEPDSSADAQEANHTAALSSPTLAPEEPSSSKITPSHPPAPHSLMNIIKPVYSFFFPEANPHRESLYPSDAIFEESAEEDATPTELTLSPNTSATPQSMTKGDVASIESTLPLAQSNNSVTVISIESAPIIAPTMPAIALTSENSGLTLDEDKVGLEPFSEIEEVAFNFVSTPLAPTVSVTTESAAVLVSTSSIAQSASSPGTLVSIEVEPRMPPAPVPSIALSLEGPEAFVAEENSAFLSPSAELPATTSLSPDVSAALESGDAFDFTTPESTVPLAQSASSSDPLISVETNPITQVRMPSVAALEEIAAPLAEEQKLSLPSSAELKVIVGAELPVAQSASSPVTLVSVEMHPLIQSPVSVEASPLAKIEAPLADAVSVSLPSSTPAGLATETLDRPFSSNVDTIESEALFPEVSSTPLGSTQSISSAGAFEVEERKPLPQPQLSSSSLETEKPAAFSEGNPVVSPFSEQETVAPTLSSTITPEAAIVMPVVAVATENAGTLSSVAAPPDERAPSSPEISVAENNVPALGSLPPASEAISATNRPLMDRGILTETFHSQNETFRVVSEHIHLAKLHFTPIPTSHPMMAHTRGGYSAGDETDNHAGWVKFFGQHAQQRTRKGVSGYEANMGGIAIGIDKVLSDKAVLGAALSWANMGLNYSAPSKTIANSYQAMLYGAYQFNNPLYLDWLGGIAYNNYHNQHQVFSGSLTLSPTGTFSGWQYGVKGELGYVFHPCLPCLQVIPLASLYYSHLAVGSYTESGGGNANQSFAATHFNILQAGAGMRVSLDYTSPEGNFIYQPEAHAMAFYDFKGDMMETTSQFAQGGPSFNTLGLKPAQGSYNLGASISTLQLAHGIVFTASYDFDFKQQYASHSGFLKVRYEW